MTWVDTSKIKRKVQRYNDKLDDYVSVLGGLCWCVPCVGVGCMLNAVVVGRPDSTNPPSYPAPPHIATYQTKQELLAG